MKIALGAFGTIISIFMAIFFQFKHSTSGLICAIIAILFFATLAWLGIKDRNLEKNKTKPHNPIGVMIDDNTGLIIKVIADESNGFVTLSDIVRDTGLRPKRINPTLDWLCANGFATIVKGRNGKAYVLTPEGRGNFSRIINENINKIPA